MARVIRREWLAPGPTGRRGKHVAFGYTAYINGKRVRKYDASWSRQDAQALAALLLDAKQEKSTKTTRATATLTFGEAVERYVKAKARKKSLAHDALYLHQLEAVFGAGTPLTEVTAARINEWRVDRLATINPKTGEPYAAATINRPLAAVRHLLRLAHEEGLLESVPRIRLEREPEGRIRWLEPDEEARLLAACAKSRNKELATLVTLALETGMRRGELLGLTWPRVDLSRGVIRLEVTKSGRRREIPMRQVVYDALVSLPGPREGRVFRTRSVRTAFDNAAAEAQLDDFRLHDCRHHFASWFMTRRQHPGAEGDSRPQLPSDDDALCPPLAGAPPCGDGEDGEEARDAGLEAERFGHIAGTLERRGSRVVGG
jgi:integrase